MSCTIDDFTSCDWRSGANIDVGVWILGEHESCGGNFCRDKFWMDCWQFGCCICGKPVDFYTIRNIYIHI